MRYQISWPQTARVKGFAFSSSFLQALWQAVQAVCDLIRALANQKWLYVAIQLCGGGL